MLSFLKKLMEMGHLSFLFLSQLTRLHSFKIHSPLGIAFVILVVHPSSQRPKQD